MNAAADTEDKRREKRTITDIRESKKTGEEMVYMSVPDYTSAKCAEMAGVDVAVVGALAIEDAGCFMLEFEAVPAKIARLISEQLAIPTIGIGAGAGTDGQILLCHDLLGVFTDFKPKFTKRFAKLTEVAVAGIKQYVKEVKEGAFPDDDHSYTVNEAEFEKFAGMVARRRQI
jgi:ketopantoate hydroxymethyltransferase